VHAPALLRPMWCRDPPGWNNSRIHPAIVRLRWHSGRSLFLHIVWPCRCRFRHQLASLSRSIESERELRILSYKTVKKMRGTQDHSSGRPLCCLSEPYMYDISVTEDELHGGLERDSPPSNRRRASWNPSEIPKDIEGKSQSHGYVWYMFP